MALWETLVEQSDFLAEQTRKQRVFFILARSKISIIRYQVNQYDNQVVINNGDGLASFPKYMKWAARLLRNAYAT